MSDRLQNTSSSSRSTADRLSRLALALLFLAYVALWWSMAGLPYQDLPNHVARALIMSDALFEGGRRFGADFAVHVTAVPYVLGDLALAALVRLTGPDAAGRLWVIVTFTSLPASVCVFMLLQRFNRASIAIATLLSFYLATDYFFMAGFMSFRLAAALTIVCVGLLCSMVQTRPTTPLLVAYVGCLTLGYFTHLSALLFVTVAAGTVAMIDVIRARRLDLRRQLPLLVPPALFWLLYMTAHNPSLVGQPFRPDIVDKLLRIGAAFERFDFATEATLFGLFAGVCLLMCGRRPRLRDPRVVTYALLMLAYIGVYFVLPSNQGTVFDIDRRAMSLALVFLAMASLALFESRDSPRRGLVLIGATALAALNLSVLTLRLRSVDHALIEARAVAKALPPGSHVLPLITVKAQDHLQPFGHSGSWATIEGGAVTPYLFSGDRGDSMTYFRYKHHLAAPWPFECSDGPCRIDWTTALRDYDFVFVIGPVPKAMAGIPAQGRHGNEFATILDLRH